MTTLRVLITTTSGTGHLLPLVPIAEALAARGHMVVIAAPEEAAPKVRATGFECLPFDGLPDFDPRRDAVFEAAFRLPADQIGPEIGRELFGRLYTTVSLPRLRHTVATWQPDLVISESGEAAGPIAADEAGLPWRHVTPSLASLWRFTRHIASGVGELREAVGLDPDRDGERYHAHPQVGYFPPSFEFPDDRPSDVVRVRDPRLEARADPTPHGPAPRGPVYVTFGTESSGMPFFEELIKAGIAAGRALGFEVVVGLGSSVDPSRFGPAPDGVELRSWVDQAEILGRARAVICHAGAGTTLGAITTGVPIVAIPLFADQPEIAERIAATGCGLVEPPGPELEGRVTNALRQLVEAPPAACAALRQEIAGLDPMSAAVAMLEAAVAG